MRSTLSPSARVLANIAASRTRTQGPLREILAEAWDWSAYGAPAYYLHPAAGVSRRALLLIPALRRVRAVLYHGHVAWTLLRTPPNGPELAPWDAQSLRWKSLALVALPFRHDWPRDHDSVLVMDVVSNGGWSWSATILSCPTGLRVGRLGVTPDGDSCF